MTRNLLYFYSKIHLCTSENNCSVIIFYKVYRILEESHTASMEFTQLIYNTDEFFCRLISVPSLVSIRFKLRLRRPKSTHSHSFSMILKMIHIS